MHLDDSACNLASINLLHYLSDDDGDVFDVEAFTHTVEVFFTAQEILVGNADYPTEGIAETSRRFRQLGLGYANLGAMLMALGLPYDSDAGRAWAGAVTALMTGHAYATSARTAGAWGPSPASPTTRSTCSGCCGCTGTRRPSSTRRLVPARRCSVPPGAAGTPRSSSARPTACATARPASSRRRAPSGLLMDCDTTGIEPDLGLCKMKKLVGGGTMTIVNQTVPRALRRLGYRPEQVAEVVAYIDENKSILGAPHVAAEHIPVFACSMGDNDIHYRGHVR
jgi:ribonucleoside-diphosphate reductase alpha chain